MQAYRRRTVRTGAGGWSRHKPHLIAEGALIVAAIVPSALSAEFRIALGLAAVAALLVSAGTIEAAYRRHADDRANATVLVTAAAWTLLGVRLSEPSVGKFLSMQRRIVMLG